MEIIGSKKSGFSFRTYGGVVKAVRDVSFEVRPEKSWYSWRIRMWKECYLSVPDETESRNRLDSLKAERFFIRKRCLKMNKKELRQFRGKRSDDIFQDPMTSLNPTMRIGKQIEEVFVGRKGMSAAEKKAKALEILKMVGISHENAVTNSIHMNFQVV